VIEGYNSTDKDVILPITPGLRLVNGAYFFARLSELSGISVIEVLTHANT
jgi:hypothetical protein